MSTAAPLVLPERTKRRFNAGMSPSQTNKIHDVRSAIPLVKYTNPADFPPYEYRPYPKMPLRDGGRPIYDDLGHPLVFQDADEELEFMKLNPELAEELRRNEPQRSAVDALQAAHEENQRLRARMEALERQQSAEADARKPNPLMAGSNDPAEIEMDRDDPRSHEITPAPRAGGSSRKSNLPPSLKAAR